MGLCLMKKDTFEKKKKYEDLEIKQFIDFCNAKNPKTKQKQKNF